jgi:serine/threonine-protein kinase
LLAPGDHFDRYVIEEALGRGGMGDVYRARDTLLERRVALKILRPASEAEKEMETAYLLREARAAAAIDHANAIAIFDVGKVDGAAYLAMELIEGRTLRALITEGKTPVAEKLRWLVCVASALGAAHRRGVLHRDIKPENVMVRDDGVVKVLDFGIARSVSGPLVERQAGAQALPTLTKQGLTVGTPLYMAPEQMRAEKLDARADQFTWGVLAYELLTGKQPWVDATPLRGVSNLLGRETKPIREMVRGVPEAVEEIVQRTLRKRREDRYETIDEVATRLEAVVDAIVVSSMASMPPTRRRPDSKAAAATAASTPVPTAAVKQRLGWFVWGGTALGVAAIAVGIAVAREMQPVPVVTRALPATSAMAPPKNAEALAAYRAGMQAFRDAAVDPALANFERATALDPTFAAAHLRAMLAFGELTPEVREHSNRAMQFRTSLDEHDRALLDAMFPWTDLPENAPETVRRLSALHSKNPRDADYAYNLCHMQVYVGAFADAVSTCVAASAADPGMVVAIRTEGLAHERLGQLREALAANDRCLAISPGAINCLFNTWSIQAAEGMCDDAVASARRLVAQQPDGAWPFTYLANALFASGAPVEAVRDALSHSVVALPAEQQAEYRRGALARLAAATGDFAEWDDFLAQTERTESNNSDEFMHLWLAEQRWALALEEGRTSAAADIANQFLARRAGWTPYALFDSRILALGALRLAGKLSPATFATERTRWLEEDARRPTGTRAGGQWGQNAGYRWVVAFAMSANSKEEAAEALEALPRFLPLPDPVTRATEIDGAIGNVYRLAGRLDEAIPFLRRAARACLVFEFPVEHTWATLHLGEALEATGDRDGACEAFSVVLARWGTTNRPSRGAIVARNGIATLRCDAAPSGPRLHLAAGAGHPPPPNP